MEQYYEKKKRRTTRRVCSSCDTILSKYNNGELCEMCKIEETSMTTNDFKERFACVNW